MKNQSFLYELQQTTTFKEMADVIGISEKQVGDLYLDWNADLNREGFSAEHFTQWLSERINDN